MLYITQNEENIPNLNNLITELVCTFLLINVNKNENCKNIFGKNDFDPTECYSEIFYIGCTDGKLAYIISYAKYNKLMKFLHLIIIRN